MVGNAAGPRRGSRGVVASAFSRHSSNRPGSGFLPVFRGFSLRSARAVRLAEGPRADGLFLSRFCSARGAHRGSLAAIHQCRGLVRRIPDRCGCGRQPEACLRSIGLGVDRAGQRSPFPRRIPAAGTVSGKPFRRCRDPGGAGVAPADARQRCQLVHGEAVSSPYDLYYVTNMLTELNGHPDKEELTDAPRAAGVTNAPTIAVVGLGYVGLPLAVEFGKRYRTIGFDLSAAKIAAYRTHVDPTGEVSSESLRDSTRLQVTCDAAALQEADFIVVAVPT